MMNIREVAGIVLLTLGSVAFGLMLAPIILAGFGSLTPFESLVFADGAAATAVGAWMILVRKQKP